MAFARRRWRIYLRGALAAQGAVRGHADAGSAPAVRRQALAHRYLGASSPDRFLLLISLRSVQVTIENPQIAFTRQVRVATYMCVWRLILILFAQAPPDGMQNIIWAFSHTPPGSADPDAPISIHHKVGRGTLNLTLIPPIPGEPPAPIPPMHPGHSHPHPEPEDHDEKPEGEGEGGNHDDGGGSGGTASFVHGALCTAGFLLVIPSGALVARYAKVTGSSRAFLLHRLLQFGVGWCPLLPPVVLHSTAPHCARYSAGVSIAGGSLAYLFMDNHGSSVAHKVIDVSWVMCPASPY